MDISEENQELLGSKVKVTIMHDKKTGKSAMLLYLPIDIESLYTELTDLMLLKKDAQVN